MRRWGFAALIAGLWLSSLTTVLKRDYHDLWVIGNLILMACWACFLLWKAWHEDRRLRRTLALLDSSERRIGDRA